MSHVRGRNFRESSLHEPTKTTIYERELSKAACTSIRPLGAGERDAEQIFAPSRERSTGGKRSPTLGPERRRSFGKVKSFCSGHIVLCCENSASCPKAPYKCALKCSFESCPPKQDFLFRTLKRARNKHFRVLISNLLN